MQRLLIGGFAVAAYVAYGWLSMWHQTIDQVTGTDTAEASTLPTWVPAPGEVAVLTQANGKIANQFESQAAPYFEPFYFTNTVNDYSGAFKNPYWGQWGATVFWGGGHAGTNDNTVTVAEYGDTAITFKRVSDPTPWTGSTASDGNNRINNSRGNFNGTTLNLTYMEGADGQPGAPHSYSSGDIIGPEHGGAQYGTLVQIAASAVNAANDAGAAAAHRIDFDTTSLQKSNGQNRKWTRVTDNLGPANFVDASPHYTAFVPAQNRIYYFASGGNDNVRWFDLAAKNYVTGTGTGFFLGESDGFDSGIVFHVPERDLLVAMYPYAGQLKMKWMDVSVNQPTVGGTATLSQNLAISNPWSAATWVPDNNRIVLAGVTNDNTAAYEIEIPQTLTSPWNVTRAPFGAGQTFAPYDKTAGIGLTYKKFQYDSKVKSIVYMPRANRDGADETIWVYRPRQLTPPTPVDGSCGASHGTTTTSAPTTGLCATGTASSVTTNANSYTWSCAGANGGSAAACSATRTLPPLPTASLSASATDITSGQSSTLTWSSTNATSCTASGGWTGTKATSGTQSVSPTATTTYSLSCTGDGGVSTVQQVTINVTQVPVNGSCGSSQGGTFSTPPTTGLCATGTASSVTTNASTYTWDCAGMNGGTTASCSATRTVVTTPTVTFTANPTSKAASQSSVLTWSATGATSCTASNGWTGTKATSGSQTVSSTTTRTYTLTCTGAGGSTAKSVTVSVIPRATATLSASPTTVTAGQSSTLTWSSTNATSCTASGGWTGTKATSGTQSVSPTATTTYSLSCAGIGGTSTTRSATVTVSATPPAAPTATISANPASVAPGGISQITWSSNNATSCSISNGSQSANSGLNGSAPTPALNQTTTYTFTCTGAGGIASKSVTVTVGS